MEKLSIQDLREALKCLLEVVTCPICLEIFLPNAVICNNGHPVCKKCTETITTCPLCEAFFSDVKDTFVRQIVEVLPHPCSFRQCQEFVKTKDDHEHYCGYRPTTCKICDTTCPGKEILNHVKQNHFNVKILQTDSGRLFDSSDEMVFEQYSPEEDERKTCCVKSNDNFFWCTMENSPADKMFYIRFRMVPNGRPDKMWHAKIELKSEYSEFVSKIKLNLDPLANPEKENCISVPISTLVLSTDKDANLKFSLKIMF